MSLPKNGAEWAQASKTQGCASMTENLVSTACPRCGVRFALLAHYYANCWMLRCVECLWNGPGELKPS